MESKSETIADIEKCIRGEDVYWDIGVYKRLTAALRQENEQLSKSNAELISQIAELKYRPSSVVSQELMRIAKEQAREEGARSMAEFVIKLRRFDLEDLDYFMTEWRRRADGK